MRYSSSGRKCAFGVLLRHSACGFVLIAVLQGAAQSSEIRVLTPYKAHFPGTRTVYQVEFDAGAILASSLAVAGRSVWRTETFTGDSRSDRVIEKVEVPLPTLRDGVALSAELTFALMDTKNRRVLAETKRRLWILPVNPFADRMQWLEQWTIHLFDPRGKTAKLFEKAGIPHRVFRNPDIVGSRRGMVVVGEGISFRAYRGLFDNLVRAAEKGTPVLCLAPSAGDFAMPGSGAEPAPNALRFRRGEVVSDLDKRLDSAGWPPDGTLADSTVRVVGERGRVSVTVSADQDGWPWMETDFRPAGSRLVVCCFPIVARWEQSPNPRYFLLSILEKLNSEEVQP